MTETTVRASAWGKLFDCAYRFEGENLLGMRKPSGLRAALGSALHASTAAYDSSRMRAEGIKPDDAAGVFVDRLRKPEYDVDLALDDLTVKDAEKIGLSLHAQYCMEWSPRYEFAAVEMQVEPLVVECGGGVNVRLTGTLDRSRIVTTDNGSRITDLKSGARAVENGAAKTKGHAAQVGIYELLYEHTTGAAITGTAEIIGMQTSGKPKIAAGEIANAKQLMVGTTEQPGLIAFAAQMFRTGLFYPNPNSMLCGEKYCARWASCPYHR